MNEQKQRDKFSAVWVSHTSISDFLACPKAYYLKNVYKQPKTGKKIKLMSPALALGQAVHDALDQLSVLPRGERFSKPLMERYNLSWKKVSGKKGGFFSEDLEHKYKRRGEEMMTRVYNNPGPIANLSVKIQQDLPYIWLTEEDNIILCGKVDWLEYLKDTDSVHIIDFKTGKGEEKADSLQLPIYTVLVSNCQKRPVTKASYWYLGRSDTLIEKELPSLEESHDKILKVAKEIELARKLERYKCAKGDGCMYCRPFQDILDVKAEFVGLDQYGAEAYVFPPKSKEDDGPDSIIL